MRHSNYDIVYFIGIGGIGMSALARWFNTNGFKVAGYDRTATNLTYELEKEGIDIHYIDAVDQIPREVIDLESLIIYTPAIPDDHEEYNFLNDLGHKIYKRSEVLGLITQDTYTIAVAGTHGKTTTSSMVAHILKENNYNIETLIGGITTNYNSNYIVNRSEKPPVFIVEADEYDRSFLTLNPNIAVITSADADHLDIYGQEEDLQQGFRDFINKIDLDGTLIINEKITELADHQTLETSTYGINRGQFFASNISIEDGFFIFDLYAEKLILRSLKLGVPGFYNVENAVAAATVALKLDVSKEGIKKALESYSGVKRRFEFVLKSDQLIFVDDYAHHPDEIEAFISSLREMYKRRKITVIFQPHLYSRTRDFHLGFAESLSLADRVILLDIYPARENPIPGITSELIFDKITHPNKVMCTKAELIKVLEKEEIDVLATVGAGDIDRLVEPIKNSLMK